MPMTEWTPKWLHLIIGAESISLITVYAKIKNLSPLTWIQVWKLLAISTLIMCFYFGYKLLINYLQKKLRIKGE